MNEMVGRIKTVPTPESITVIFFRFFFSLFLRFSSGFEPPTWKKNQHFNVGANDRYQSSRGILLPWMHSDFSFSRRHPRRDASSCPS